MPLGCDCTECLNGFFDDCLKTDIISNSRLIDGLNAELYNALDNWFDSLDLLMEFNDCILDELIGRDGHDLRRIYKAYQAIKATGIYRLWCKIKVEGCKMMDCKSNGHIARKGCFGERPSNTINELHEIVEWLNVLLDYAEGRKKWDTSGAWVCESHPRLPYEMGYAFDCECGAPGIPPCFKAKLTK